MPRILIVDDEELARAALARLLARHGFESDGASCATEARELLGSGEYELMLADVNMPGESGLELAGDLLSRRSDIAVVIVTGLDDPKVSEVAIDRGAYGFINKPLAPNEVIFSVKNALRRRAVEQENRYHREKLEQIVGKRTYELEEAFDQLKKAEQSIRASQTETIRRLSKAAEFRDNETARHIDRMSRYCKVIALCLGIPAEKSELIRVASPLHDVGKLGTPDQILLKPGKLTAEEFEIMKTHAEMGYRILTGSQSELLELAAVISRSHHEKFDGSGYPDGLAGEDIPLEGRIAAVADVFDALTSKRVYKDAMPVEKALSILREGRGTHFDPRCLDAFLAQRDDMEAIRHEYADG